MSEESTLIEAAKQGDTDRVRELLEQGADPNQKDPRGWTALNWAAGRGDTSLADLLLEAGADVTASGRDGRTPLMIAKAAGRDEVAQRLAEAEKEKGTWEDPRRTRPYCKAYYLDDLRKFSGWSEKKTGGGAAGGDGDGVPPDERPVVYLHQDFTVTRSMWHGEDVMFDDVTPEWRAYCRDELDFEVPDDLL